MLQNNHTNGCMDDIHSDPQYNQLDICPAFEVVKIVRVLDRDNVPEQLVIEVNDHNKRKYTFQLPTSDLFDKQVSILHKFTSYGLVIYDYLAKDVCWYLTSGYNICRNNNMVEYCHHRLGWFNHQGKDIFLYDVNNINGIQSTCTRSKFKFRRGNQSDYENFLRDTVYPVPTLALAMAISYSAVIVGRLAEEFDMGTLVVNICGASSTGKTTVEQLMVSPFGCPEISNKEGLIRTFHATQNALFAGIDGYHGLPLVLDDVTTNPYINTANLIYTLASGEEKGRCDQTGALRSDTMGWQGVVVISSETPIEEQSSENQGLKVRVLQTQGITWTPDAATAQLVKSTVLKNYGFTGLDFANFVASIPMQKLRVRFESTQNLVHSLMTERDNLSDRLEIKYTPIALTIELMNEFFQLTLNANQLMQILLAPEQYGVRERDISKKALEVIKNFVIQKRSHFAENYPDMSQNRNKSSFSRQNQNPDDRSSSGDNYGTIVHYDLECHVYIATDIVDRELRANQILETATVKERWKINGITKCDKDRLDMKHLKRRSIHFIFPDGFDDDAIEKPPQRIVQPQREAPVEISNSNIEEATMAEIFGDEE